MIFWVSYNLLYEPSGFNLSIYRHNATLTLNEEQAFDRNTSLDRPYPHHENSYYLDYTGFQHLLYTALEEINITLCNASCVIGFQLWHALVGSLIILLLSYRSLYLNTKHARLNAFWGLLIFAIHPSSLHLFTIASWEDKIIILLIMLLVLISIEKRLLYFLTSFVTLVIGWNGILVFFLPCYALYLWRNDKANLKYHFLLMLFTFLFVMLPFFPDSLDGWENRSTRNNIEQPFWFSIYLLLPDGVYSSTLNEFLVLTIGIVTLIGYWRNKLSIVDTLIISVILVVFTGPFNSPTRLLPVVLFVIFVTPCMTHLGWLLMAYILFSIFMILKGLSPANIQDIHVIIAHLPIFLAGGYYSYKRLQTKTDVVIQHS